MYTYIYNSLSLSIYIYICIYVIYTFHMVLPAVRQGQGSAAGGLLSPKG